MGEQCKSMREGRELTIKVNNKPLQLAVTADLLRNPHNNEPDRQSS